MKRNSAKFQPLKVWITYLVFFLMFLAIWGKIAVFWPYGENGPLNAPKSLSYGLFVIPTTSIYTLKPISRTLGLLEDWMRAKFGADLAVFS